MESHTLHMISMKALLLAVLAITATACGMRINDEEDDEATAGHDSDPGWDGETDDDDQKNELILITDGAYGVELSSTDVECEKHVGATTDVLFTVPDGSVDGGLTIHLFMIGDFTVGDALTPDNSGGNRYFAFELTTPAGDYYAYSSLGQRLKQADFAALTILKATDYATGGRIWIENLALKDAAVGSESEPERTLSVRGSFECAAWE